MTTRTPQITLYGNLGGDPEPRSFPASTKTIETYNPVIDGVETREVTRPERNFLVASLAVNFRDEDGNQQTRWHRLIDHEGALFRYRKGDHLEVNGFFRTRSYVDKKTRETKTIRELIVTGARLKEVKIRHNEG